MNAYTAAVLALLALFFGYLWFRLIAESLRSAVESRRSDTRAVSRTGEGVNS